MANHPVIKVFHGLFQLVDNSRVVVQGGLERGANRLNLANGPDGSSNNHKSLQEEAKDANDKQRCVYSVHDLAPNWLAVMVAGITAS